jgi:hypothetical protein
VLKERESIKAKGVEDWQWKEHLWDSFIETVRKLQHGENDKQTTTTNEEPLQSS